MGKEPQKEQYQNKQDEHILVVQRNKLLGDNTWQGLYIPEDSRFVDRVLEHKEFQPRSSMEQDLRFKQIIPYLIFHHAGKLFLMQRKAQASEQRLQNKYSIGIGGHIRQEDIHGSDIHDWAQREFHEEVSYDGSIAPTFLGVLNDDSNEVGQVHAAFVYLLHGDTPNISVKSELKSGTLVSFQGCLAYYDWLESWSQIVLNTLKNHSL